MSSHFWAGFDGLGFHCNDEPVATYMLELLKNDYFQFMGNLKVINSVGDQCFLHEAILHKIPADDFVSVCLSLEGDNERLVI